VGTHPNSVESRQGRQKRFHLKDGRSLFADKLSDIPHPNPPSRRSLLRLMPEPLYLEFLRVRVQLLQVIQFVKVPEGQGYGTATLSSAGVVTLAGMLADGTPVTLSTTISQAGTWRLFAQLYPGLQGFLAGDVIFDHDETRSDFELSAARWICPVQDRQHYPLGWTDGITLNVLGAKYIITAGQSVIPLFQDTGTGDSNADLRILDGLQTPSLTKPVDISAADVVTEVPSDVNYTLSINRATGAISGTFKHADGTTVPYNGVVYQKNYGINGGGFFRTTTPAVKDYTGQSGAVFLQPDQID
jgi:hypothetical protein